MNRTARLKCLTLLTLGVFASALPAAAAEPVRIWSISGPFSGFIRPAVWVQRIVDVRNDRPGPRTVRVVYRTGLPGGGAGEFYRTVTIPGGAIVSAAISVRPLDVPRTAGEMAGRPGGDERYLVRDADDDRQLISKSNALPLLAPDVTAVAMIPYLTVPHDTDRYLSEMPSRPLGEVQKVRSSVHDLPDEWYGYDAIDLVVVGEMDFAGLRASQRAALLDWTRRGGTLVLAGRRPEHAALSGELAAPAGVVVAGAHYVDSLAVRPAGETALPTVTLDWPLPMMEIDAVDAEVLYEAGGLPLLTRRALGDGRIFTLATPVGALADPSLHEIWRTIGRGAEQVPPIDQDAFAAAGARTLGSIAGRRGPPTVLPVGILVALAGAVCIAGVLLRRRRRGELLWAALVPVAAILALGLYIAGRAGSDPQRLSYVALIGDVGGGRARLQEAIGYYAGPEERLVTFSAGTPSGIIQDAGGGSGIVGVSRTSCDAAAMALSDRRVRPGATEAVYIDGVEPLSPVTAELTFGPGGLTGTFTGNLPADITDAVIYAGRITYAVGDIPTGRAAVLSVGPARRLGRVSFPTPEARQRDPNALPQGEFTGALAPDRLRNRLIRELLSTPDSTTRVARQPVLIGRAAHAPLRPFGEDGPAPRGWSLVVQPLRTSAPPSGAEVVIPAGFVDRRFIHPGAPVWNASQEQFIATSWPLELRVAARPPASVGPLENPGATLRVGVSGLQYRLVVSGVRAGGETVELETFDAPAGPLTVQVENASRFALADGSILLSLKMERLDEPAAGDGALAGGGDGKWQFDFVEVILKGTAR